MPFLFLFRRGSPSHTSESGTPKGEDRRREHLLGVWGTEAPNIKGRTYKMFAIW